MKNRYAAVALTTAAALFAACSPDGVPTGVRPDALKPSLVVSNTPVTGAAFTTVNETVDDPGHCKNGNPNVNCNIYDGKEFVWLNGGPSTAYVGDGDYFFAVLVPGGQPDPNDGGAKNLSDDYDAYGNRTFSVTGATVAYLGGHDFDGNKIRLADYANTTNPGGVYILAICSLADGYPVTPSKCKYDAFKIQEGDLVQSDAPTIVKDAAGAYDNTFVWTIDKAADRTLVNQSGGNVTFNYTVKVEHDAGTISGVKVTGKITVFNPNVDNIEHADVTDELSDATVCTVDGGADVTLGPGDNDFDYECSLASVPASAIDNTARVEWPEQTLTTGLLAAGFDNFLFSEIDFTPTLIDESVQVTDPIFAGGVLGTVTVGDANPKYFYYSRTVAVTVGQCVGYDNTATFTTNDTQTTGSDQVTVTVCGPIGNGFTLGFWSNKNGATVLCQNDPAWRNLLNGASIGGLFLRNPNGSFYAVPTSGNCKNAAANLSTWLLNGNATNMSYMLSVQLAATMLDVAYKGMPGSALVTHPVTGLPATINSVIADAITLLRANGNLTASSTARTQATAYKNLFDALNNNQVFVLP